MRRLLSTVAVCTFVLAGCGESIEPQPRPAFGAPLNVRALSVSDSVVRLSWSPPSGATASSMKGYQILYGSRQDTAQPTATSMAIAHLPPGEIGFILAAIMSDGSRSDAATIRWAPAARFDSGLTLTEYYPPEATRASGCDLGNRTANPTTLAISPSVQPLMDVYLTGEGGQALELRSASLYLGTWNVTAFSTVSTAAASLDTSLAGFPAATSFTLGTVPVVDDVIYYVLVTGATNERHYARVHVHGPAGAYPNRTVQLRVSLQRVPWTPFAAVTDHGATHRVS
jgi:hypothetical protein